MKSKMLIAVFFLFVFGVSACSAPQDNKPQPQIKTEVQSTIEVLSDKTVESTLIPPSTSLPRYVEYSNPILEQASSKRRVLFFYASWCSTCRPADANLTANTSAIPEDLVVIRVNYSDPQTDDEEKALANKYGITYQHTFVQIDGQGNEVTKWNGGQINELLAKIK